MKKVLSFVLVLSLVLSSFSMAFAGEANTGLTDIAGNANEEAITVVNDLGIVTGYEDGTFKAEKNVNRAEFAAMITRALAVPQSALAGYTATNFKDTTGYDWAVGYLAFCESKGIMLGDGNGNAMPGKTIDVNEAVTMVLRAIGYTNNSAVLVGSWPANYVTLAQDLGLYTDVAAVATVDRASAAQLIYNVLGVGKVQVNADGETNGIGATMLNSGLKCSVDRVATLVTGNEDAVIDLSKYMGAQAVKVWNEDDEVIAITEVETSFITVDEIETGYIVAKDGTKYYTNNDDASAYLFENGKYTGTTGSGVFAADNTIAVTLNSKTITDVYSVIKWTAPVADFQFTADDLDVDGAELYGEDFVVLEDDSIDYDSFTLVGAKSLDTIAEDAVVYIYNYTYGDADTVGKIAKIVVGTETVTGTITKKTTDGFFINDTVYEVVGTAITDTNIGEEGTATLDGYGNIYAWEKTNEAKGNYAVAVKVGSTSDAYGAETYYVTFVDAKGVEKECEVKNNITTDAVALTKGDIFEYALDTNGKLKKIDEKTPATLTGSVSSTIIGTTPVNSDVVVWAWDADEETYVLTSVDKFDTEATASASKAVLKNGKVVAMIAEDAILGGTDPEFGVISDVYKKYNAADETTYWYVEGVRNGVEFEAYTDVEADTTAPALSTTGTALYTLSVDADGVLSISSFTAGTDVATYAALVSDGTTTVAGVDGGMIKVEVSGSAIQFYALADGYTAYVWDADDEIFVVKKLSTNTVKGKTVTVYQTEDDVKGYDLVVVY